MEKKADHWNDVLQVTMVAVFSSTGGFILSYA